MATKAELKVESTRAYRFGKRTRSTIGTVASIPSAIAESIVSRKRRFTDTLRNFKRGFSA